MKLIKLTDRLSRIVGTNRGRFPFAHGFLAHGDVCALIDTGCGIEVLDEIRDRFSVDLIINSHCHPDHSAGNWLFPNARIFVPKHSMESHGRLDKLSYRFFGLGPLADHWRSWIANTMGFRDMLPTDSLGPGHMFDFGTVRLQAIHTPGHTADHHVFLEPTDGVLLSGDIDLTSFGPWYGNLESDLPSFRRSIQLLRDVRPRVIAPGHGEPVFDQIDDAFGRYANVLDERNRKILALLQTPLSVSELVDAAPVYGHHPYEPELLRFFEHRMIEQHLEELEAGGLVRRSGPGLRYAAQ